jgi:hypothetical protein
MSLRQNSTRDMLLLFLLALVLRVIVLIPVAWPGYMDAAYSYDIALNLHMGAGLNEPFLWNYLDQPTGIPHPSHLYWMPLPTFLAAASMLLFGTTYAAAQVPFVLIAALLPLVSYWITWTLTQRRSFAWIAGLLTVFSGFYVPYWGHTDNFAPFALSGSLALIAAWQTWHVDPQPRRRWPWALVAGAMVGLAHLSRADGVLLLLIAWLPALGWLVRPGAQFPERMRIGQVLGRVLLIALGYLLVMLPWFARNWLAVGAVLPTGGSQTLWLTTYDDLFSYGKELTWRTYLDWGWANIWRSKLQALGLNAQTVIAVWGMVFLTPLVIIGWWRLRRRQMLRLAGSYGLLLFLVMTFAFTFPGPRGGLFHSGGALLPFIYTASLVGLDAAVTWASRRRSGWNADTARRVFGVGLVLLAILFTSIIGYQSLVHSDRWRGDAATYEQMAAAVAQINTEEAPVMIGDPTLYWYVIQAPALVIPNAAPEGVLAAAEKYGARYLVLDANRPEPLAALYAGDTTHPKLIPLVLYGKTTANSVKIWRIGDGNQ